MKQTNDTLPWIIRLYLFLLVLLSVAGFVNIAVSLIRALLH